MNSKSIIYIIFSFGNGGTQRMLVNILNEIIPPNSKRIVYLYNDTSKDSIDFNLDPNIKMVNILGNTSLNFY